MDNVRGVSYVASPLSEYIGSHIYEILGCDALKTVLGICHDSKRYYIETFRIRYEEILLKSLK